ncbi:MULTISPECIES: TetR/AcrR family transcriptional regulator [Vibrio]|uniref:TetR/AcrR family transcriptional regulator n=1 Tax=Vibrio mediterranei TaxID=689 RepID=A0A3G4VH82_9VIBR|nr:MULTISPECIES: TetR/AcrR family transcriptional regulator [Vibrio]AYV24144.1 TetR/AcrR family transcriptional regulator [Vibrio mediterranei]MCF4173858.1 TetR/AcrR family transcriptional regulator [Vibrio sp. McD22-P3]USE03025.1 TetR/AcrR family transcriptional regulator [Vibrio sp. SCSIO 43133]
MTVKAKKRGRPTKGNVTLSKEVIVENAKRLMQVDGKIPSIRRLATELNIDAMAIYYYFKNKDELLEAVAVSLVEGIYLPEEGREWQQELQQLGWSYLELLGQYPGLLETLFKMKTAGPANVFISRFNQVIEELDLSTTEKQNAVSLLADYLHGFAFSMQFSEIDQQAKYDIYQGSITLYLKAVTPSLSS